MGDNLRDVINGIESGEKETAVLLEKIEKLERIVKKQKIVISDLEEMLEAQKEKSADLVEIPEDIRELKAMIGELRVIIREKDMELEHVKADLAQAQMELELTKKSARPAEEKLKETFEQLTNLKTLMAEKDSELMLKSQKLINLESKIRELEILSDNFKGELDKRTEELQEQFIIEKQELKAKIKELESKILDEKLTLTEKQAEAQDAIDKYDDIRDKFEESIKKLEEANHKRRDAEAKIDEVKIQMKDYKKFYDENAQKISQNEKLTELMEHEPQFKAFLILEKVGSMTIEELRAALGSPMVITQRFVKTLEDIGLVETNEAGKIMLKKITN